MSVGPPAAATVPHSWQPGWLFQTRSANAPPLDCVRFLLEGLGDSCGLLHGGVSQGWGLPEGSKARLLAPVLQPVTPQSGPLPPQVCV